MYIVKTDDHWKIIHYGKLTNEQMYRADLIIELEGKISKVVKNRNCY